MVVLKQLSNLSEHPTNGNFAFKNKNFDFAQRFAASITRNLCTFLVIEKYIIYIKYILVK